MDAESVIAAPSVVGPEAMVAADAEKSARPARKPRHPDDFDSEEDFLEYIRTTYSKDLEADQKNREEAILDAKFVAGDQWEASVQQRRHSEGKPTLTINRLPAYVAQLIGNRRLSETGISIIPDHGGTKQVAKVREGLIRNIQKVSRAQYAYDKAFESQVISGIGAFQIHLDYAHDDVFEQDIRIAAIPNMLSVVWDQASTEPSGSDARHVFVVDKLPRKEFERRYPKATAGSWDSELSSARAYGWDTAESVQVVSFWRMRSVQRTVALFTDGAVRDVTDLPLEQWYDQVMADQAGSPMIREVQRRYAQMHIVSSQDILAGPYDLPVQRVPVFRVPGWELFIEGDRKRWGLIRFLRDPQKLHNYWRSVIAEKLTSVTKAKWIAADSAVEGRHDEWRRAHLNNDPLLVWNAESGQPPVRVPPADMEMALVQEAGIAAQDIREVSNLHEASMGAQSNEVSGKAIMARQRVGEVGTVIYQDNLNIAIEEAGKVINQLIPFVYDTPRVVKVLGPDMQTEEHVKINYEDQPDSVDITSGKYSVSVTTGPSYTTRRVEAREEMMGVVNAMPDIFGIAADKIIEAQDWPGADEIARRLRSQLPPGVLGEADLTDEERAAQASQMESAQQEQALKLQAAQLELADKEADVMLKQAKAQQAMADAMESRAKAELALAQAQRNIAEIEEARLNGALDVTRTITPAGNGA